MYQQQVKLIYLDSIKLTLKQQIPSFVICLLVLDGGVTLRVCLIAILGYWLFAMLALVRSVKESDPLGLLFLRWGFFPLFGLLLIVNSFLHPMTAHRISDQVPKLSVRLSKLDAIPVQHDLPHRRPISRFEYLTPYT